MHPTASHSSSSSSHNHGVMTMPRKHTNQWALLQQRLRRNCLVGPVTVCLLVLVGMPYVYNTEDLVHRISLTVPMVEAVPFFRKAKVFGVRVVGVVGGAEAANPGSSGTTSTTIPRDLLEPQQANSTVEQQDTSVQEPSPKKRQKLNNKGGSAPSKSASATTPREYNFPLLADFTHDSYASRRDAPVPMRYLEAHPNEAAARKATLQSLKWRRDLQIDTILSRPHVNYDVAKRILPHYFIGRSSVTNHVVFVQRPGLSDLALAKHNDIAIQDMLLQYAYVFEYCWNVLHPHATSDTDPNALMIGILDLHGINLSILRKPELINFVKEFVGMIDAHYPSRAYKTYMINAPQWFSGLYKLVSPIMRETTKEKIVLYSAGKEQEAALEAALGPELATTVKNALRIPDRKEKKNKPKHELALTSDILLETQLEQEIRNFVLQRLHQEGLEMKPILSLADPKPQLPQ